MEAFAGLVVGKSLQEIVSDFRGFYRLLTSDSQMRWVRADTQTATNDDPFTFSSAFYVMLGVVGWLFKFFLSCLKQLGPEKGVIQLAAAAVLNAVWDLWAKAEGKVGPLAEALRV